MAEQTSLHHERTTAITHTTAHAAASTGSGPAKASTTAMAVANTSGGAEFRSISPEERSLVTSSAASLSCTCSADSSRNGSVRT